MGQRRMVIGIDHTIPTTIVVPHDGKEGSPLSDWSPFEDDVFLKGLLIVVVRNRRDGSPRAGQRVVVRACGFV